MSAPLPSLPSLHLALLGSCNLWSTAGALSSARTVNVMISAGHTLSSAFFGSGCATVDDGSCKPANAPVLPFSGCTIPNVASSKVGALYDTIVDNAGSEGLACNGCDGIASAAIAKPSTAVALRILSANEMMPRHMRDSFFRCEPASLACVLCQCAQLCAVVMFLLVAPRDKLIGQYRLWLALMVLLVVLPTTTALQDVRGTTHEEVDDFGREAAFANASPFANSSSIFQPRVTRRLTVINVQPGAGTLQAAHDAANAGDELVLADGTYTSSGGYVLQITKSITIRALNPGMAVLDGQNARRVVYITSGTVVLEGLDITGGSADVRDCGLPNPSLYLLALHLLL